MITPGGTITLMSTDPDPETLRFPVLVDGGMSDWTLDRIKQYLTDHQYTLTEWNAS